MSTLRTIITAALVSFGVATVAAPASRTPSTHGIGSAVLSPSPLPSASGPSLNDIVKAQGRRIDKLQNQLAETRGIALEADAGAGEAQSITRCITHGVALIERADGSVVGQDQGAAVGDQLSVVVPTLDDSCVEAGS